jgi:hypothetical protein
MTETGKNIGVNRQAWNPEVSRNIVKALTEDIISGAVITKDSLTAARETLAEQNVTLEPGEIPSPTDALWSAKRTVTLFENIPPVRRNDVENGKGVLIDITGKSFPA